MFEEAEILANAEASDDQRADAIDRLTAAIYRIGVDVSGSIEHIGNQIGELAERVDELRMSLKSD